MTTSPFESPRPDGNVFPFADLLATLRERGFGVGMHEYNDMARLASRWKGIDRNAFRDAVAALLARNAEEVERIRAAFDEWADTEPPAPPPPLPPPRKLRPVHIAAIALIAGSSVVAGTWWQSKQKHDAVSQTRTIGNPPPPVTPATTEPRPPQPTLPPAPRKPAPELPWLLAAIPALAALLFLIMRRARNGRLEWVRRYWDHVLEQMPGPHHYQHRIAERAPPLPCADVEEIATVLGRARQTDGTAGDTLDVEESLRLTLRAGLRPHLVFEPPPRNVPVLVLQDVAWQMRPWQRKVDYFVEELVRQGVVIDRWYFNGDPLAVSRTPHGRLVPLETLGATRSESPLMILSSGQGIQDDSFDVLDRLLRKWSFGTILNPIGNPAYWRREMQRLPIHTWPMTRFGVRAAAVEITRKRDSGETPRAAARRDVTRADVEQMKQLIAMVPHPSLDLADELRQRFCPDMPEEVLLFLGAEGVFYGDIIQFPPEQLRRLLDAASRDPQREREVRGYLLGVLRESEPPAESVAHLRWQLDEAMQRLRLNPADPAATATLRSLAEGPFRDEVRDALALAERADVAKATSPVPASLPEHPPETLGKRPPVWAWPTVTGIAVAIGVLVISWLLLRPTALRKGDPIQHRIGDYTLQLDSTKSKLIALATKDAPGRAGLFRNGDLIIANTAVPALLPISNSMRGTWLELRAELQPDRNLAASVPLWVPALPTPQPTPQQQPPPVQPPPQQQPPETPKPARVLLTFVRPSGDPITEIYWLTAGRFRSAPAKAGVELSVPAGIYQVNVDVAAIGGPVILAVGQIRVAAGQSFQRQFTVPDVSVPFAAPPQPDAAPVDVTPTVTAEQTPPVVPEPVPTALQIPDWVVGDVARRVWRILIDAGAVAKNLEPSTTIAGLTQRQIVADALWQDIDSQFKITMDDSDIELSDTVENLIEVIRKKLGPTNVTLTFVSSQGSPRTTLKYQLIGSSRTLSGVAGTPLSVESGTYRVTVKVGRDTVFVDSIEVQAGESLTQQLAVPPFPSSISIGTVGSAANAEALQEAMRRRRTLLLRDPKGEASETWKTTSGELWTVTYWDGRTLSTLQTLGRATVNSRAGIVVTDGKREFFIPDQGEGRDVLVRSGTGAWTLYLVLDTRSN